MKRPGFTLIELLVVISILSVLTALTSAGSHYAREQAKALKCKSNLHELSLDLIIYSVENDRFPRGLTFSLGDTIGDLRYDLPVKWWFQDIGQDPRKSGAAKTLLQCPTKKIGDFYNDQQGDVIKLKYNVLWGNYGVNWSVCSSLNMLMPNSAKDFARTSLAYAIVKEPSQVALLLDSGYALAGWQHAANPAKALSISQGPLATSYIPGLSTNKDRELHLVQQDDAVNGRHPNQTVNVAYVDGHVEQRKADDLLVTQTEEGQYSNRTPLWKPR